MNEEILHQIMNELKDMKSKMVTIDAIENMATKKDLQLMASKDDIRNMATKEDLQLMASKDDIKNMATKKDLQLMASKDDIQRLEDKMDKHSEKININLRKIAKNTEQLNELSTTVKQHDQILEVLALRSIEQEGKLRKI